MVRQGAQPPELELALQQGRALKVPCHSSLLINLLVAASQAGPGQEVREQKLEVRALYQQV